MALGAEIGGACGRVWGFWGVNCLFDFLGGMVGLCFSIVAPLKLDLGVGAKG